MNITSVAADAVNTLLSKVGIKFRFHLLTPDEAQEELSRNPDRLSEYGLSQRMCGDYDDSRVSDAKGRPYVDVLVDRIVNGNWKFYLGVILVCKNGAIIDGVSRYIAVMKAGTPVWVLKYVDANPEDFRMIDDEDSSRTPKDVLLNSNVPKQIASILAVILPKATTREVETSSRKPASRDEWYEFYTANKIALDEAAAFVQTAKGNPAVVKKNLAALMYFHFVSDRSSVYCTNPEKAKALLTTYKSGMPVNSPGERAMADLASFFKDAGRKLLEREHRLPLFREVLKAALSGRELKYSLKKGTSTNGTTVYTIVYSGRASKENSRKVR